MCNFRYIHPIKSIIITVGHWKWKDPYLQLLVDPLQSHFFYRGVVLAGREKSLQINHLK